MWSCDLIGGRTDYYNPMAWLRLLHNLKIASLRWPLGWMAPTNSYCQEMVSISNKNLNYYKIFQVCSYYVLIVLYA